MTQENFCVILRLSWKERRVYMTTKLDYSLENPEDRVKLVDKIIQETPPSQLTNYYKETLANYIISSADKKERKKREILTEGRMVTVNKRETSYEALVDKLENGEDGLYNLIREDKNTLLSPKDPITQEDIDGIPHLKTLRDSIAIVEPMSKAAIGQGKKAFLLKRTVIQMRQDQYVIRNGARPSAKASAIIRSLARMDLPEIRYINDAGEPAAAGIVTLFNYKHVSALLAHYSLLKQEVWDNLGMDMHYLLMDLESVAAKALSRNQMLYDLMIYKIDGRTNLEIQKKLDEDYGIHHSLEYLSALWRNKIPKLIAEQAQNDWLIYHYTFEEKGHWKKCSRCGQIKLAHNRFFSRNKTSKDGFYSICKACRNKKH